MIADLRPDERRAAPGEFASLAEAEAWLDGLRQTIGSLPHTEFIETIMRVERVYDQFPELAAAFPRHVWLRRFRAVADTLPDAEALPLLLLCAAAEPSQSASRAGLFERAARAGGGATLLPLLRLFRRYRDLGWEEIGPAVTVLAGSGADDAVLLESVGEILGGAEPPPEAAAALGRILAPRLFPEPPAALDPAALARAAAGARRRLAEAAAGDHDAPQRRKLLARAERLKARLQPPLQPSGAACLVRSSGALDFPSFLAQWPDLAIEVPACQLYTRYAVLDRDGVLRAERHAAGAFCYGPYLNLPAGRYCLRIDGEADSGAEYVVRATHTLADRGPVLIDERRYVRQRRITGAIAELAFASDIALRDFEVVVDVASPSAAFAIVSVIITADRLRPDPKD
jgi:hypothetical protein